MTGVGRRRVGRWSVDGGVSDGGESDGGASDGGVLPALRIEAVATGHDPEPGGRAW